MTKKTSLFLKNMALKINKMKEKEKRGERTETSIRRTPHQERRVNRPYYFLDIKISRHWVNRPLFLYSGVIHDGIIFGKI
jgi:hypothetical protein